MELSPAEAVLVLTELSLLQTHSATAHGQPSSGPRHLRHGVPLGILPSDCSLKQKT
jgi:hypothetical protein